METNDQTFGEWDAPALRPIARWVLTVDERGRSRLVMRWQVPDVRPALLDSAPAPAWPTLTAPEPALVTVRSTATA